MKKNLFIIIPVLVVALIACAQTKKTTSKTSPKKLNLEYVLMKRTACFGRCPMYKIELYKDGTLRYTGERFIKDSGVYEKNIGAANAEKLLDEFRKYRIDTCKEEYSMPIADLPGIYYNYKINGVEKKIVHAEFGPDFLKSLAMSMDDVGYNVDHSTWKKITPTK